MYTLDDLLEAFGYHHEIEFSLDGHPYFAAPQTNFPAPTIYAILDAEAKRWICRGSVDDIINFEFPGGKSMKTHFEQFCIEYVL